MELGPDEIRSRIRAGHLVADADFDLLLPDFVRSPSVRYWTPVGVAMRASRWLQSRGVTTVLDVGSGAGKFCVVGALSSPLSFTGVEQRGHLVDAAHTLAERLGVSRRVSFLPGDFESVDFRSFDALYFYNPFGENIFTASGRLDDTVEISRARFVRETARVEVLLRQLSVGVYVVTYNSYGGRVPDSFDLVQAKVAGINLLRLWYKARAEDAGGYWLELPESTLFRTAAEGASVPLLDCSLARGTADFDRTRTKDNERK